MKLFLSILLICLPLAAQDVRVWDSFYSHGYNGAEPFTGLLRFSGDGQIRIVPVGDGGFQITLEAGKTYRVDSLTFDGRMGTHHWNVSADLAGKTVRSSQLGPYQREKRPDFWREIRWLLASWRWL